jgi:cellulose synthase operon protein YhjU
MGLWASYFLGEAFLHHRGHIRMAILPNLLFAALLLVPLPRKLAASRSVRWMRFCVALCAAFALLWHETAFPPLSRTVRFLSGLGGLSPAYLVRFVGGALDPLALGVLLLLGVACVVLNRRMTLAPLALAAILSVPLFAPASAAAETDGFLERFFDAESRRVVHLGAQPGAAPAFDVVVLHVCSLAWSDLRAVELDRDAFFRQFDLVLTDFNTASSYTNPSAIRLLRATCGQSRHAELYRETRRECYLLDALRARGYSTYTAIDNVAPAYRFPEDIAAFGHADAPIDPRGLPVRQLDFDDSPIYDDLAVLQRWWDLRRSSPAPRAVLYADLTTMHGGAHWVDDRQWWKRGRATLYREFGERLFANLTAFFQMLQASGRNHVVVFVPEHGMALQGSSIQPPDMREIPLPDLTTVPVGVKLIGGAASPSPGERQVRVAKPTSYLAIAYLLSSFLQEQRFDRDHLLSAQVVAGIPETPFVAENEGALAIRKDGKVLWLDKQGRWTALPESASSRPNVP